MEKPPVLSDELDKVIEGWEYVARHEKGTISKAMMEQILKTIQLLYGYKQARQDTAREIFDWIDSQRQSGKTLIQGVGYGVAIADDKLGNFESKYLIPPNPVGSADV